jgi:hypothetical protein
MMSANVNLPTTAVIGGTVAQDPLLHKERIREKSADCTPSATVSIGQAPVANALEMGPAALIRANGQDAPTNDGQSGVTDVSPDATGGCVVEPVDADSADCANGSTDVGSEERGTVSFLPLNTIATLSTDADTSDSTTSDESKTDCPESTPAEDVPPAVADANVGVRLALPDDTSATNDPSQQGDSNDGDGLPKATMDPCTCGDDSTLVGDGEAAPTVQIAAVDESTAEAAPNSSASTVDGTAVSSTDAANADAETPVVDTFGGINTSTGEAESDPAPLHPVDTAIDDSATDTPPTATNTPVIYTMDPIDVVAPVELHRKDVKHLARELKRGHSVDIDVNALMQLHTTAKKQTRKLVERVIATTYLQSHLQLGVEGNPGNPSAIPHYSFIQEQAFDQAYAAMGAPERGLKVNGARLRVSAALHNIER